jgi:hypothetical protein
VTLISTVPDDPAGLEAVISVAESTVKLVAAEDPKSTMLAPRRFEPAMTTDVDPPTGPEDGVTEVTDGAPS